ncbi:unnamed protein product [Protopolystoma xenopodis]|uniref:Uncharacterized protein n=1 Tax=Protopolystoma xenopodis TaxID=117903 RepID=A0A448X4M2_9PLAT|nr:unnamed protein product [Protopolystoma xenopodis]
MLPLGDLNLSGIQMYTRSVQGFFGGCGHKLYFQAINLAKEEPHAVPGPRAVVVHASLQPAGDVMAVPVVRWSV